MRFHGLNNSSVVPLLMPLTSRRTLLQALIVSLLIHAVLLLRVVNVFPVQMDTPGTAINVLLRRDSPREPSKSVSTPVAKPPAKPVKPAAPVVRDAVEKQIVVPEPSPVVIATPPPTPSAPEARDAGQHVPTSPAGNGEATAVLKGAAGGSAPVSRAASAPLREGVSVDDLRQYRLSLATAAKRFKRYPVLAKERGWEGTVDVALTGNAWMPEPEIVITRSSGRRLLDEQALAMVTQAARATTLPDGMRGRNFRVQLSMEFSLSDDQ